MTHFDPSASEEDPAIHPEAAQQAADDALAARVEALRKTIADLTPKVETIQTEQKTVWSWLKGGGLLIAFDLALTILGVVFGFYLHQVQANNETLIAQVQDNQARLDTSIHETCSLYGTFLSFYSDASKTRFAGGPAQYDKLYLTLQTSADRLQCGTKHVVPGT